jgi:hypothetical protein
VQIAYLVITILFAVRVAFSGLGKTHRDPHQMQVVYKTVGYPDAGAMLSSGYTRLGFYSCHRDDSF